MGACTLHIGSRVVLVSQDGPPTAEFALFDPEEIELSTPDHGGVRESGYRTTARQALRRLAVAGVTLDLAEESAACLRGRVAAHYARGPAVRRLATRLGPAELFDGGTYDATLRRYDGTWLALPLLASDAEIASATGLLQALSLTALLSEVSGDTPVLLSTLAYVEPVRLGDRTLRRHVVDGAAMVPRALRALADRAPRSPSASTEQVLQGPSREAIAMVVRDRLEACAHVAPREHLNRILRALAHDRPRPSHGPLADPELWALERALGDGSDPGHVLSILDARELARGREPGTVYLRARASLLLGREAPHTIATRIGPVAIAALGDFPELELLAAQAWDAAGEIKNALPFARDLVANPRADDELRAAAEAILRAPRGPGVADPPLRDFEAAPEGGLRPISVPPPSSRSDPPRRPSHSIPPAQLGPPPSPQASRTAPSVGREGPPSSRPPARAAASLVPPASLAPPPLRSAAPPASPAPPPPRSAIPPASLSPPPSRSLTPPSSRAPDAPRRLLTPPERMASPLPPRAHSARPASLAPSVPPRSPLSAPAPATRRDGTERSDPPEGLRRSPSGRIVQPRPWPAKMPAPREESVAPLDIEHTPVGSRAAPRVASGASVPPTGYPSTPPAIPRAPVVPRVDVDEPDLVETLPFPRGVTEALVDVSVVPRTPAQARARFTVDARELARRYRHEQGVELRVDARAVLAMQRHLIDRFRACEVTTSTEARDAELHGALLSELLARVVEAEWADLSPSELGHWTMQITLRGGGTKRVKPFGRVLRFIATGGEEDLVGFFRSLREG